VDNFEASLEPRAIVATGRSTSLEFSVLLFHPRWKKAYVTRMKEELVYSTFWVYSLSVSGRGLVSGLLWCNGVCWVRASV